MAENDRLAWLKKLRATKASLALKELMAEKGWIDMEGSDVPPWEDQPETASPTPKKRDRNEYFREYMRKYREKKKAEGAAVNTTETTSE